MVEKYDYLVVGSGLFGSTFANLAKNAGKKVLVIEKRKNIAGNIYTEEIEGINEYKEKIKKEGTIKIEPKIFYDKFSGDMKIEFKIGNKKMYKIKRNIRQRGRR